MLVAGRKGVYFKEKRESRRYKWKTFFKNSNGWFYLRLFNARRFLTASTDTHTSAESKKKNKNKSFSPSVEFLARVKVNILYKSLDEKCL